MSATERGRWLARLGTAVGLAAGLTLVVARPATAADYVPVITVAGSASCSGLGGDTNVSWVISQTSSPEGFTYGGTVTFQASPDTALNPDSYMLITPLRVRQVIPHGTGAHTATMTVHVAYELPTGHTVLTSTGSITLPACPRHTRASVTFAMRCDRSVDVTITYPTTGEAATTATVTGRSLSGASWTSGPVPLRPGGDVRSIVVPSPYTTDIVVTQPDAIETQADAAIGRSGLLMQPTTCPLATTVPGEPSGTGSAGGSAAGNPVGTSPADQNGDGVASGGGGGGLGDPGATVAGSSPPDAGSTDPSRVGRRPAKAEPPAAGARTSETSLGTLAALGAATGLGTVGVVAAGLLGFFGIRQRRRAKHADVAD